MTDLKPGRELDMRVAEAAGWKPCGRRSHFSLWMHDLPGGIATESMELPEFSSDLAAAFTLLEDHRCTLRKHNDKSASATIVRYASDGDVWSATGDSLPHAICLAFVAAHQSVSASPAETGDETTKETV